MDQAVLVDAYVYECAECGDIGDESGKLQANGQVFDFLDVLGETERFVFLSGIPAWQGELFDDIG